MKQLALKQTTIDALQRGQLRQLLLLGDPHNLTVNDLVAVVDQATQQPAGSLQIEQVTIKRLADFDVQKYLLIDLQGRAKPPQNEPAKRLEFVYYKTNPSASVATDDVNKSTGITEVKLYGDGGSRGNPGPAAAGWVLYDLADQQLQEGGLFLGTTTNNVAEYTSLKMGLHDAQKLGARRVQIYMDSLLVINQMKGLYKVRNAALGELHAEISALCRQFQKVTFTHVPRALNSEADRMVNQTLDAQP